MKKIKVLEVMTYSFKHGGIESLLMNIIKNYDFSETQMDLLCLDLFDNDYAKSIFDQKGVRLITKNQQASKTSIASDLNNCLKNNRYDVVHIHSSSILTFLTLSLVAKINHTNRVLVHSHSIGTIGINHFLGKFLSWFVFRFSVDEYLACSLEAGKRKFPGYAVKNKLTIIKNGIDLDTYKIDTVKQAEYRRFLGVKDDEILIGHVGRFDDGKNHKFIIELFFELRKKSTKYKLLLLGDGPLVDEIKAKVKEYEVEDSVIFTGNVDNVFDYLQAMDVFLFPSKFEGLGIALVEAQACGIPAITSTGVPKEAKLTDYVEFISLEDKQRWIDTIEYFSQLPKTDNTEIIRSAGYDIKSTAELIKNVFTQK